MSQVAELPLGIEEKPLGFGLMARIRTSNEPREAAAPKEPAQKACPKCNALLDESNTLTRKREDHAPETFTFCKRCAVYLSPAGEKLGTRW